MKSIESIIRFLIKRNNHNINTSFPAIIVGTQKLSDGLVDVQPIVNFKNRDTGESFEYPVIRDVSLIFPSTSKSSIVFPVEQGDTVLLVSQSVDTSKFKNGSVETHDPRHPAFGNLANVVAFVGFSPYQNSSLSANNYTNDIDNRDLNIVHNKGTDSEITFKLTSSGDLRVLNAKKVSYECESFEIIASEKIKLTAPLISENGR